MEQSRGKNTVDLEERIRKADDGELILSIPEGGGGKSLVQVDSSSEEIFGVTQLGSLRFVYAAYMAMAVLVAFILTKLADIFWVKLASWNPRVGEPKDEVLFVISAVLAAAFAVVMWRREGVRHYVQEVAEELTLVSWPSKKEVTNSTAVVVLATLVATAFFALMDQFWNYLTDHVYGI